MTEPIGNAVVGTLKRPADMSADAASNKSPRLEALPESLPGTVDPPAGQTPGEGTLEQQLTVARAEGARWREECEEHRRQLELANEKIAMLEGLVGGAGKDGQQPNGLADDSETAAKMKTLQSQLADAKGQVDMLRSAAKGHVQKINQLELQLRQAQQGEGRRQFSGGTRYGDRYNDRYNDRGGRSPHGPPGGVPPFPPPPRGPGGMGGGHQQQGMVHGGGFPHGAGGGGGWGGAQHAQQFPQHAQHGGQQFFGAGQPGQHHMPGQQPPQHGAAGQAAPGGGYYDWSSWEAQQAQQGQHVPGQQGAGDYWAQQAAGHPQTATPAAGANAVPVHAPYYSQTDQAPAAAGVAAVAADPYSQQLQVAGAYPAPPTAQLQPKGPSDVDVDQIWAELDPRKRDVLERFAQSYPLMVDPSQAKEMCITDFKDMTEAQLEGFFMWLPGHCNPSRHLRQPGGFIRVKHTEWKKLFGM